MYAIFILPITALIVQHEMWVYRHVITAATQIKPGVSSKGLN